MATGGCCFLSQPLLSCVGLMAIFISPTVEGDSEEGFWAVARVQKVEQLNAALSLLLWLLHIQQVTHFFFFFSPNPTASRQLVFSGGGCGIFWLRGRKHTFLSQLAGVLVSWEGQLGSSNERKKSVATLQWCSLWATRWVMSPNQTSGHQNHAVV